MGESMMLYSLLLLKNLEQDRYNEDDWEFLASVSNIYCMGVATGDLANFTEEERAATALTIDEESTTGDTMVFYRKLAAGQDGVERRHGPIHLRYMAVRWVRDAQ